MLTIANSATLKSRNPFQTVKAYAPNGYDTLEEFSLSSLPQQIDIVVIRLLSAHREAGPPRGLSAIMARLNRNNLLEVKSPTDSLHGWNLLRLLGYALQFMVLKDIEDPGEVTLFTLSDGIPARFLEQIERCGGRRLEPVRGVMPVEGLLHPLYCIDSREASKYPVNHLLYVFSRGFLEDPSQVVAQLEPAELVL